MLSRLWVLAIVSLILCLSLVSPSQADPSDHQAIGQRVASLEEPNASGLSGKRVWFEDPRAYSLLMHRSCGVALLALGAFVLADRLTKRRHRAIRSGIGLIWLGMGIHIVINADPRHWPMGAGFIESFAIPSPTKWIEHKVLSLVPITLITRRTALLRDPMGE